ncbi:thioredoxin peroxidase Tpx1 [Ranunculus cassubicifolius]
MEVINISDDDMDREFINISDDDDSGEHHSRSGFITKARGTKSSGNETSNYKGKKKQIKMTFYTGNEPPKKKVSPTYSYLVAVPGKKRRKRIYCPVLKDKETPISVNEILPPALIFAVGKTKLGNLISRHYDVHSSLRAKKVVIYALPGYLPKLSTDPTKPKGYVVYKQFYNERIIDPVYQFVEKYEESLKANGIHQILFWTVNVEVITRVLLEHPKLREKHDFVNFITDANMFHTVHLNYYDALGLKFDIKDPELEFGERSRRFILVVDDLKVKLAHIESIKGEFNIPSSEEIVAAAFV